MKHIRVFGCSTQILIRKSQCGGKFAEVTQDGVLLGFVDDNCNYQVYNLDTDKVVISHNLFFNEGHFPFRLYPTQHLPDPEPFEQPDTASSLSPLPPAYSNKPVDDDKIPPPPFVPTGPTHLMPIPPLSPQLPPDAAADPLPPPLPTEPCRRSHQVRNPPITYNPTTGNPAVYCPSPRVTASLAQAQVLHPTFWCD